MIADLDKSLRTLLIEEMPISNGEIDIKFEQPTRDWSARLTKPTINLFLYNVRENATLRQHQWQSMVAANGHADQKSSSGVSKKRTPFRVDATYMLSVWAAHPEDEHRLLTRALIALFRHPMIPTEVLEPALLSQPFDLRAELGSAEKLANPAEIWGSLNNDIKPIVPYVVTLALDPWPEITGPIVTQFEIRAGQAQTLPNQKWMAENEIAFRSYYIGGTVRNKAGEPLSRIEVALKGTGWMTRTDMYGRFRFSRLPAGDYALIVWPQDGKRKPVERQFSLTGQPSETALELNIEF